MCNCDGFFFKNKNVVVVGGGNTAGRNNFLSNICKKVTLIHRRDKLRAEKILQNRLFEKTNVEVIWNNQLMEIIGKKEDKLIEKIIIKNTNNYNERELILDGLFVAIGHKPATEIFLNKLEIDNDGYILTKLILPN